MQLYQWRARTVLGKAYEGEFLAANESEVANFVRTNFGYVTDIKLVKPKKSGTRKSFFQKSVKDRERALFFKHLQVLLSGGLPLLKILQLLQDKMGATMAGVCRSLSRELQRGNSFAKAMSRQPAVFPKIAVAAVEAGEMSGKLEEVLAALNKYFQRQNALRRFLVNASLYPLMLIIFALLTLSFFMVKVMPMFSEMYASFDVQRSGGLQLFFTLQAWASEHFLSLVLASVAFLILLWGQRQYLRKYFRKIPRIRNLRALLLEVRFSQLLALLLQSGISLPQAIETAGAALDDKEMEKRCAVFAGGIVRGISVYQSAALAGRLFSETGMAFLHVGENSGSLAPMLVESAAIQEQELMSQIRNLKAVLEPILILVISGLVLLMVMAVIGPMFSLINQMPEYK